MVSSTKYGAYMAFSRGVHFVQKNVYCISLRYTAWIQSVLSRASVNLPLKYSGDTTLDCICRVVRIMAQRRTGKIEAVSTTAPRGQRARGVLDLSWTKLIDRPALWEEKLLKTSGVIAAEIIAFFAPNNRSVRPISHKPRQNQSHHQGWK